MTTVCATVLKSQKKHQTHTCTYTNTWKLINRQEQIDCTLRAQVKCTAATQTNSSPTTTTPSWGVVVCHTVHNEQLTSLLSWKLQNKHTSKQEAAVGLIFPSFQSVKGMLARCCRECVSVLARLYYGSILFFICRVGGCGEGLANAFQSMTDSRFSPVVDEDRRRVVCVCVCVV